MSPKQYARLIRVKKASILMAGNSFMGNIGAVATNLHYYDQSHFIKDFKTVIGQTPSQYLKEQR